MTSTRIEATRQARQAEYRPAVVCDECDHVLSIAEQIERFCTRCKSISPDHQEGKHS